MTPLEQAIARLEELSKYGFRPPTQYIQVTDSLAWVRQDLELVLHTPTADEVCKALSEYLKEEVKYIPHRLKKNGFYLVDSGIYLVSLGDDNQVNFSYNDWIKFNRLPTHIITLIGRFYEGLEVKK